MKAIDSTTFTTKNKLGDVKPIITVGGKDKTKFVPNINMSFGFGGDEEIFINLNNKNKKVNSEVSSLANDKISQIIGNETEEYYVDGNGRLKWDTVFDSVPKKMNIEYDLEYSEGIEFAYQGTLAESWKRDSRGLALNDYLKKYHRPDEIVGSIAIYCHQRHNIWEFAKVSSPEEAQLLLANEPENYKLDESTGFLLKIKRRYANGKLLHIFRPFLTDADGKTAWCDMSMPSEKKLKISMPKDFWVTAKFPVRLDPTLGYSTAPASRYLDSYFAGVRNNVTAGSNGTANKIYYYTKNDGVAAEITLLGYYNDNAGALGTLADGNKELQLQTTDTTAAWRSVDVTGSIISGNKYYPAVVTNHDPAANHNYTYYDEHASGSSFWLYGQRTDMVNNPTGVAYNGTYEDGLYLEYVEGVAYVDKYLATDSSQSPSFSVTIPAGATLCLLGIASWTSDLANHITAISLDGQAGVLVDAYHAAYYREHLSVYSFAGFGTGSKTFSVTRSAGVADGAAYMFVFVSGEDPVNPIRDHNITPTVGENNSPDEILSSPNLNSSVNDIIVAFASGDMGYGHCYMQGGLTELYNSSYNASDYGSGYKQGSGSTDTVTSNLRTGALAGIAIRAAAGGTVGGFLNRNYFWGNY